MTTSSTLASSKKPTDTIDKKAIDRDAALNHALELTLKKGMPLHVAKGIPKKHMDALYTKGYNLYAVENYEEAKKVFRSMAFYSHLDKRAWMGLAGSTQMLKDYENALRFYGFASLLDLSDPVPHLHIFDCLLSLNKFKEALDAIERVILLSSKDPKHALIKKRAEFLRDALKKN